MLYIENINTTIYEKPYAQPEKELKSAQQQVEPPARSEQTKNEREEPSLEEYDRKAVEDIARDKKTDVSVLYDETGIPYIEVRDKETSDLIYSIPVDAAAKTAALIIDKEV